MQPEASNLAWNPSPRPVGSGSLGLPELRGASDLTKRMGAILNPARNFLGDFSHMEQTLLKRNSTRIDLGQSPGPEQAPQPNLQPTLEPQPEEDADTKEVDFPKIEEEVEI